SAAGTTSVTGTTSAAETSSTAGTAPTAGTTFVAGTTSRPESPPLDDDCIPKDGMLEEELIPTTDIAISPESDSGIDDLRDIPGSPKFKGKMGEDSVNITISLKSPVELKWIEWVNPSLVLSSVKIFVVRNTIPTLLVEVNKNDANTKVNFPENTEAEEIIVTLTSSDIGPNDHIEGKLNIFGCWQSIGTQGSTFTTATNQQSTTASLATTVPSQTTTILTRESSSGISVATTPRTVVTTVTPCTYVVTMSDANVVDLTKSEIMNESGEFTEIPDLGALTDDNPNTKLVGLFSPSTDPQTLKMSTVLKTNNQDVEISSVQLTGL
ncbi:unnamed protein product, partial [Owenia fusiformis]